LVANGKEKEEGRKRDYKKLDCAAKNLYKKRQYKKIKLATKKMYLE